MTILEAAGALRSRAVSSAELTHAALDRAVKLNGKLNIFLTFMEEAALARARKADEELRAGVDLGPLHGVPVAVKDVFETRGVRTTCGSKLFATNIPDRIPRIKALGNAVVPQVAEAIGLLIARADRPP